MHFSGFGGMLYFRVGTFSREGSNICLGEESFLSTLCSTGLGPDSM